MTLYSRPHIVETARANLGTAYAHQGRTAGVALDCLGLCLGVYRALGFEIEPADDEFAYGRMPDGRALRRVFDKYLVANTRQDLVIGDFALIAWRRMPMHCGIIGAVNGYPTLIHALAEAGRVVEHRVDDEWRRRIIQTYSLKGIM